MRRYIFGFSGNGSKYFCVWILNVFVFIATFGIYPTCKSKNQYLITHTTLNSYSFSYLRAPVDIFKLRFFMVVIFAFCIVVYDFSILAGTFLLLIFLVLLPLAIRRLLMLDIFIYRDIEVRFYGDIFGAYKAYLFAPIVALASAGILLPYALETQMRYRAQGYHLGRFKATFIATFSQFYRLYIYTIAFVLGFWLLAFVAIVVILGAPEEGAPGALEIFWLFLPLLVLIYIYIPFGLSMIDTMRENLLFAHLFFGEIRFTSNFLVRERFLIYAINFVLITLTFGLYTPFAIVRLARYRAERICVLVG
ncbi:MAG: DUF898 family protein [Wolinella sp.]